MHEVSSRNTKLEVKNTAIAHEKEYHGEHDKPTREKMGVR